jgi:DNA-3-methyladenine glycosylase I
MATWYCDVAHGHPVHGPFHDNEHGYPLRADDLLFERLALEIMQAGLSWLTVLKKREAFRSAFANFDPAIVADFTDADVERLMADAGIVRNRLKILALINNAQVIVEMRRTHGGFAQWLDSHHPQPKAEWLKLFKKTFRFTGGEIVNEFLMGTGYLPGAHSPDCPIGAKIALLSRSHSG